MSFFALCVLLAMPARAYKKQSIDVTVGGQKRNIVVFTPNVNVDDMPLMIVTHGMNQSPEYQYDGDKMYELIDTAKFVVAYPRSDGNMWDTGGDKDKNFIIKVISEMNSRYGIDTNRVYWSGFSMGSMLIYHCMSSMQDRIAAFAPTSGIQFSESPWNNCKKPVNLIQCHAYGDETFDYNQYGIRAYVMHFADLNKYNSYTKKNGYRTKNGSAWFNGLRESWKNTETGNEVVLFSFNDGGHWPMAENSYEIWNFCKRFSLDPGIPSAKFVSPNAEDTITSIDTVNVKVKASDADGYITKLQLYVDNILVQTETFEEKVEANEYFIEYKWIRPTVKSHTLKVIATDNDKKTRTSSRTISVVAPNPLQLLVAEPVDSSFDLPLTLRTFSYTFDWKVDCDKVKGILNGKGGSHELSLTKEGFDSNLVFTVPDSVSLEEGEYKLTINSIEDERRVSSSRFVFRYFYGIEDVDFDEENPSTPAQIYKGAFMKAMNKAVTLCEETKSEKYYYFSTIPLNDTLKIIIDQYEGLFSYTPKVYADATDSLNKHIAPLELRKTIMDLLYVALDSATALINEYADNPDFNTTSQYTKLVKAYNVYSDIPELQYDEDIVQATKSMNSYITRLNKIVTGIEAPEFVISNIKEDSAYDLSGKKIKNTDLKSGVFIINKNKVLVK